MGIHAIVVHVLQAIRGAGGAKHPGLRLVGDARPFKGAHGETATPAAGAAPGLSFPHPHVALGPLHYLGANVPVSGRQALLPEIGWRVVEVQMVIG